jgi:hypothetical protein
LSSKQQSRWIDRTRDGQFSIDDEDTVSTGTRTRRKDEITAACGSSNGVPRSEVETSTLTGFGVPSEREYRPPSRASSNPSITGEERDGATECAYRTTEPAKELDGTTIASDDTAIACKQLDIPSRSTRRNIRS